MVPFTPSASSCHITLQIIPETLNVSTVFVTMATKYNETLYLTSEINVTFSTHFRIDLNDTFFTENFEKGRYNSLDANLLTVIYILH